MTTFYVIAGLLALVAGLVWFRVRTAKREGRADAELEAANAASERAREAAQIDEDVDRLRDSDLDDRLRKSGG